MLEPARRTRALRELRSLCAEVGQNDPEAFSELVGILAAFEGMVKLAAHEQNTRGYSWADLARPLGVTRSAAYQRFGGVKVDAEPIDYRVWTEAS
jgi:hypothetical protein